LQKIVGTKNFRRWYRALVRDVKDWARASGNQKLLVKRQAKPAVFARVDSQVLDRNVAKTDDLIANRFIGADGFRKIKTGSARLRRIVMRTVRNPASLKYLVHEDFVLFLFRFATPYEVT
jgi:hypothetical protein